MAKPKNIFIYFFQDQEQPIQYASEDRSTATNGNNNGFT